MDSRCSKASDRAKTRVVFVTAYAEHAVRAFEANAVDYLLKPLSVTRLQESLQRVRSAVDPPEYARRLAVPVAGRMHLLPVEEIDLVTAQANYVRLQAGEREYLLRESLAGLLARLDPGQFVHVHRSRIVRIEAVRDIETLESGQYLLRLHNGNADPDRAQLSRATARGAWVALGGRCFEWARLRGNIGQ